MYNSLQFYPEQAVNNLPQKLTREEAIKLQFANGEEEITICSRFSEHVEYTELDYLLTLIEEDLNQNKHLNVFVNLNILNQKEYELLDHLLLRVGDFGIEEKCLHVFCNTNSDEKILKISAEFERKLNKQIFMDVGHEGVVKNSA